MSVNSNPPGESPRRRIVIPIGPAKQRQRAARSVTPGTRISDAAVAPAGAPKRSRLGKVLAVLGISAVLLLLVALAGGYLWWQHYKTTPAYSLATLIDAAQRNDMSTVESMIDLDQVTKTFADEVADRAANRYGLALGGGVRQQIEALTPKLMPRIKENVRVALTVRVKEFSATVEHKPLILLALGVPYVVNISQNGDTAKATAQVQNHPVELGLSRAGGSWKVVSYRDDALVQQAIDQIIQELPAIGVGGDKRRTPGLPPRQLLRIP